jgi:hypothetical protein
MKKILIVLGLFLILTIVGCKGKTEVSLFDPESAISEADLMSLGIDATISLNVDKDIKDIGLGSTSDVYTYEVKDCDFVIRDYSSEKEAFEAYSKLRKAYDKGGMFYFAKWRIGSENSLGDESFEGVKEGAFRINFVKNNYLYETTGFCNEVSSDSIKSVAGLVEGRI